MDELQFGTVGLKFTGVVGAPTKDVVVSDVPQHRKGTSRFVTKEELHAMTYEKTNVVCKTTFNFSSLGELRKAIARGWTVRVYAVNRNEKPPKAGECIVVGPHFGGKRWVGVAVLNDGRIKGVRAR